MLELLFLVIATIPNTLAVFCEGLGDSFSTYCTGYCCGTNNSECCGDLSGGAIAGIVIGSIVLLILLCVCGVCVLTFLVPGVNSGNNKRAVHPHNVMAGQAPPPYTNSTAAPPPYPGSNPYQNAGTNVTNVNPATTTTYPATYNHTQQPGTNTSPGSNPCHNAGTNITNVNPATTTTYPSTSSHTQQPGTNISPGSNPGQVSTYPTTCGQTQPPSPVYPATTVTATTATATTATATTATATTATATTATDPAYSTEEN